MKAMILAAGKGTRLHPITMTTPKPLIPLLGRPVIEHLMTNFAKQGIQEFAVNLGHLGEEIQQTCQSGAAFGADILYSWEGEVTPEGFQASPLGSAGSLRDIQDRFGFFDSTFVVVCGDAFIDLDIWEAVRYHHSRGAVATVITREVPITEVEKYGVVVADETGRVQSFQEKPKREDALSNQINAGIYIFEPQVIELIPRGCEYDIGSQLLPDLVERGMSFYSSNQPFSWLDIGNFQDIFNSTFALLRGEVNGFSIPGQRLSRHIYAGLGVQIDTHQVLHTGINYLSAGVIIEDGAALLGENVIGRNCVVEAGAILENCIVLGDNLAFSAECELRNCIVTNDFVISPSGSYMGMWESRHITDVRQSRLEKASEPQLAQENKGLSAS